ncbi:uncharacterized protein LOC131915990 [Peromyscus eremicus]|uniref:uncharacterized protein LOC131915990 n=1 Tax=Peromyscus eremicus TaxID=42410 RepID=UPI0027DD5707|nr:uncharacterized protein LOC131915990 [Peromyscus eremicus]
MSFTSQAYISTQTLVRASSTIKFFFSEAFMGQHFQEVDLDKGEPQPGDLFLFKLRSPRAQWCGAHVGVYCGHGEIIHFEGRTSGSGGLQTLLGYCEGVVCKQGHRALQRSRELWCVLRRRGGIDPKVLERRVQEAMNSDPPLYNPTSSNCVHFALKLLGMDSVFAVALTAEARVSGGTERLGGAGTVPSALVRSLQPLHSAGGAGAFKNLSLRP